MTLTGKDLTTIREIARVDAVELAKELSCSRQTVWKCENRVAYPQPFTVHKYLVAIQAIQSRRLAVRASRLALVRHFEGEDADLVRQIIEAA